MKKYYETLGIKADVSLEDAKAAYRKLAMKHHPDRGGDHKKFCAINEAWKWIESNHSNSKRVVDVHLPENLSFNIDLYDYLRGTHFSFTHNNNEFEFHVSAYTDRICPVVITHSSGKQFHVDAKYNPCTHSAMPEYEPIVGGDGKMLCTITMPADQYYLHNKKVIRLPYPLNNIKVKYDGVEEEKTLRVKGRGMFGKDLYVVVKTKGKKPNSAYAAMMRLINSFKAYSYMA